MIFSVNRWSKSRKTCYSKKPLEPEIVHTSQCVPFFGVYCPFSSLVFTFQKRQQYHVMEGNTQALELDQLDLSHLCATLASVELWISYLSSLEFFTVAGRWLFEHDDSTCSSQNFEDPIISRKRILTEKINSTFVKWLPIFMPKQAFFWSPLLLEMQ